MQINCGCKTTVGVFEDAIFSVRFWDLVGVCDPVVG